MLRAHSLSNETPIHPPLSKFKEIINKPVLSRPSQPDNPSQPRRSGHTPDAAAGRASRARAAYMAAPPPDSARRPLLTGSTMPSRQFLDRQTRLIDLFLEELAQVAAADGANFNNTKQFDALLRHLELTVAAPAFSSVPSENILHILLTLAARSPAANWSHDLLGGFAGDASAYMRQVNRAYDAALHKASLQQRSVSVLRRYLAVVRGPRAPAADALRKNIHSVLLAFHRPDVALSFRGYRRPVLQRKSKAGAWAQGGVLAGDFLAGHFLAGDLAGDFLGGEALAGRAVEIISDSEDSDALEEPLGQADIAQHAYALGGPAPEAPFSALGLNTSGLGGAAPLFRQMPHLLAGGTPEPPGLRPKRPRAASPGWKRIQVFDDHVVLHKLLAAADYDVWSLLKWAFWCAHTSSEYQTFLFNAGLTHVHHVYRATGAFLELFFAFCHAELAASIADGRPRAAAIARLLGTLGPRHDWHDRAALYVFAGLGRAWHDKPYPCFPRELVLTKNDPAVLSSRCKTTCVNDDNSHSMGLRAHVVLLLFHYEHALGGAAAGRGLMRHVLRRLASVPLVYLEAFLGHMQTELAAGGEPGLGTAPLQALDAQLGFAVLCEVTGTVFSMEAFCGPAFVLQTARVLLDGRLYRSVVDDVTFGCVDDFAAQWRRVMAVAEWLFGRALEDAVHGKPAAQADCVFVVKSARCADELAAACYAEYLESRYEDSDLIPETAFTLTRAEIEQWRPAGVCTFADLARFKLSGRLQR
ncbi:hypothetical protein METBIDRAFT_82403 [Metschnikowia bicuspidata var. bicuspidata NRRL YB-4993]|uniref:Uncharacterized protein n=1 Tax=Metschnikowia bicuspidata var. bicuspidata NRRL YB-4993 TaxID=869754 RepID=A0A1A0HEQ5_9ASCO|nr:hypothetical protein METBIDRAFT_82403 [Metschnikowia bicuspidata var. bicuspidata NRRL YB-4993]OBA22455.1 hypothetical protein METBIDRAFT_82403 [Metschnikowia bicuspidata var. bicuspidata NRRL YB-4993]